MILPKAARATEKKITIVSPSIEGAKKKIGWPVPTARELTVVLHSVRRVDPSGIAEEYPWCHGLQRAENIQRNDAQRPSGDRQAIFRTLNHWGMQYDLHPSSSAASDREMAL